jgi:hypothetical protein
MSKHLSRIGSRITKGIACVLLGICLPLEIGKFGIREVTAQIMPQVITEPKAEAEGLFKEGFRYFVLQKLPERLQAFQQAEPIKMLQLKSENLNRQSQERIKQSKQPETLSPIWNLEKFAIDAYTLLQNIVKDNRI